MANNSHIINGETFDENELLRLIEYSERVQSVNYSSLFKIICYHLLTLVFWMPPTALIVFIFEGFNINLARNL